jgi:hypothetical protein
MQQNRNSRNRMRKICSYGSVGVPVGNHRRYPEKFWDRKIEGFWRGIPGSFGGAGWDRAASTKFTIKFTTKIMNAWFTRLPLRERRWRRGRFNRRERKERREGVVHLGCCGVIIGEGLLGKETGLT